MLGSFCKQDHLLNLIILGGYAKRWPKCARISKEKLIVAQNLIDIFFLFWLSEHLSTGKILSEKKYGGSSELCPDWEAASRSGNFLLIGK